MKPHSGGPRLELGEGQRHNGVLGLWVTGCRIQIFVGSFQKVLEEVTEEC
jgi:hypothetical protein